MKIRCKKCEGVQDAESSLKKEWSLVDRHRLQLTYFVCVNCKEIHIVQLDDEQTLMCLEEVSRKLKKAGEYIAKDKTPKKRVTNGLKKKNKQLSKLRKILNECYSDKGRVVVINGRIVPLNVEMQEYID